MDEEGAGTPDNGEPDGANIAGRDRHTSTAKAHSPYLNMNNTAVAFLVAFFAGPALFLVVKIWGG